MPDRNRTGPFGEGPATGGRFGPCGGRGQRHGQTGRGRGIGQDRLSSNNGGSVFVNNMIRPELKDSPDVVVNDESKISEKNNNDQVDPERMNSQDAKSDQIID